MAIDLLVLKVHRITGGKVARPITFDGRKVDPSVAVRCELVRGNGTPALIGLEELDDAPGHEPILLEVPTEDNRIDGRASTRHERKLGVRR